MFSLLPKTSSCRRDPVAARAPLVEALEDRRLNSVSPGAQVLPAEQVSLNLMKASPKLFLAAAEATATVNKASPILFLA